MKLCVVVIAIGEPFYKEHALPVLKHYFSKNEIEYRIVEGSLEGTEHENVHPSWLKLLVHRMFPEYDYIITMDLDLLPANPDVKFIHEFDMNKLSLCYDCHIKHIPSDAFLKTFKYNCGLIGIPKSMAPFVEGVFDKHAPGKYPAWEQYHFNDEIVEQGIEIHQMPDDINCFYYFPESKRARLVHYTDRRGKTFVEMHAEKYFRLAGIN